MIRFHTLRIACLSLVLAFFGTVSAAHAATCYDKIASFGQPAEWIGFVGVGNAGTPEKATSGKITLRRTSAGVPWSYTTATVVPNKDYKPTLDALKTGNQAVYAIRRMPNGFSEGILLVPGRSKCYMVGPERLLGAPPRDIQFTPGGTKGPAPREVIPDEPKRALGINDDQAAAEDDLQLPDMDEPKRALGLEDEAPEPTLPANGPVPASRPAAVQTVALPETDAGHITYTDESHYSFFQSCSRVIPVMEKDNAVATPAYQATYIEANNIVAFTTDESPTPNKVAYHVATPFAQKNIRTAIALGQLWAVVRPLKADEKRLVAGNPSARGVMALYGPQSEYSDNRCGNLTGYDRLLTTDDLAGLPDVMRAPIDEMTGSIAN